MIIPSRGSSPLSSMFVGAAVHVRVASVLPTQQNSAWYDTYYTENTSSPYRFVIIIIICKQVRGGVELAQDLASTAPLGFYTGQHSLRQETIPLFTPCLRQQQHANQFRKATITLPKGIYLSPVRQCSTYLTVIWSRFYVLP